MDKSQQILETILAQGLVPLFYHDDEALCIGITTALYAGGIRVLEFTNRGPQALANFSKLRKVIDTNLPGMQLGIGTIKNEKDASAFIEAGADFIVCPIVHTGIASVTQKAGLLWVPGCLTATEIALAESAGAKLVQYCHLVMGNVWAANTMLNVPIDHTLHERKDKKAYLEQSHK
ncbi:MAG TPA: hypothetical protein VK625_12040, partial [Flavitalea sp.]|nr:hypothetical protein [Flavitalea sp.]